MSTLPDVSLSQLFLFHLQDKSFYVTLQQAPLIRVCCIEIAYMYRERARDFTLNMKNVFSVTLIKMTQMVLTSLLCV